MRQSGPIVRVAEELDEGLDDGVGGDGDGGIDDGGFGAEDGDAGGHELAGGGEAHGCVEVHHLGDGVGAEDLVDVGGDGGDDALVLGDEQGGDVSEVELGVGVVGGEGIEVGEESGGFEAVDAGVDFGEMELGGGEIFLFDDCCDGGIPLAGVEDAAVAGGIGGDGCQDGHGGVLGEVEGAERGEGGGLDEGDVAREDEEVFGWGGAGEVGFELLEGVAGAALLGLEDELDAGVGDGGADAVGFVANDAEDVGGWRYGLGGGDDVEEQGLAADFVEDLGAAGLEAGAFAGGEDGDSEVGLHLRIIVSWVGDPPPPFFR